MEANGQGMCRGSNCRPCIAVVGAGPAGAVTTAVLLQRGAAVKWIDENFENAGGMSQWADVPANTKVDILEHAMDSLPGLQDPLFSGVREALAGLGSPPGGWALQVNGDPAPKGWCYLGQLCNAISALVQALQSRWGRQAQCKGEQQQRLECYTAVASTISHSTAKAHWEITLDCRLGGQQTHGGEVAPETLHCDAVVLATGGRAREPPQGLLVPGATIIPQTEALSPSRLRAQLEQLSATESFQKLPIAVVGNSHSAFVIVENLYELGCRDVTVFGRRPLRFAVWDPEQNLYRQNAFGGLKGRSADFAMRHVLGLSEECSSSEANDTATTPGAAFSPPNNQQDGHHTSCSPDGDDGGGWLSCRHLQKLREELTRTVPGRQAVVYAIGFERRLPEIVVDGKHMEIPEGFGGYSASDCNAGQLLAHHGAAAAPATCRGVHCSTFLPRVYGNGLAFPEADDSSCTTTETVYEAASIPIFVKRAIAIADHLDLPGLLE